jgi:hypothetical protein
MTVKSTLGNRLVAGTLSLGLVTGVGVVTATGAQAAAAPVAAVAATTAAPPAGEVAAAGVIGAILRALGRVPGGVTKAKNAVRAGYASFKAWYDGLPFWAKAIIRGASAGMTVYDLYTLLNDYWF